MKNIEVPAEDVGGGNRLTVRAESKPAEALFAASCHFTPLPEAFFAAPCADSMI
jgi:hypothetical protein